MNADEFIPFIGMTDDQPSLQQFLQKLGAKKAPKVKRGDSDARVELDSLGIDLVFNPLDLAARTSRLQLSTVFIYGTDQGGRITPHAGTLPFGLLFSDSRDAARIKAGPPTRSAEIFLTADTWEAAGHAVVASYPKARDRITSVKLTLPQDRDA